MDHLEMIKVRELEVAIRIWHPEATNTVVAWHGLARHGGDFEQMAHCLGPEWRVLAPDTPGRGLSSWSLYPAYDYLYSHYMTIAVTILDHFQLENVDWIGTSMGGLLGMRLAAEPQTRGRIKRLVLNDIGPELSQEGLAELAHYFAIPYRFSRFSQLDAELRNHYRGFGIDDEQTWRQLVLSSARRLPDGSWSYHYDPRIGEQFVHDTPRDTWADWDAIDCPLLVIRGEDSPLLSRASLASMAERKPSLTTLEVPGCGHAPMLDRESQVAPIREFLQREVEPAAARPTEGGWWRRLFS